MTSINNKSSEGKLYLRNLIGSHARYQGSIYEIVEILDDGPSLVMKNQQSGTSIQPDQHGEAHRRVPKLLTITVPLTDDGELNPEAIDLEFYDMDNPG